MTQLNYNDIDEAAEGGMTDLFTGGKVSKIPAANVAQVSNVSVDVAAATTLYQFTVNGVTISYTSDGTPTIGEIHAGLLADAQSKTALQGVVTFSGASPNIVITADAAGTPFLLAEADANLTGSTTTPNKTGSPIPFGRGIAVDAQGNVSLPSATGFSMSGVAVMKHKSNANATGEAGYQSGEAVVTLKRGRVWVVPETVIASVNEPVYLRHTDDGTNPPGQFRNDADGANADQVSARWMSTTAQVGDLAILELNLP